MGQCSEKILAEGNSEKSLFREHSVRIVFEGCSAQRLARESSERTAMTKRTLFEVGRSLTRMSFEECFERREPEAGAEAGYSLASVLEAC